ncbi:MAG: hypothetical protein ACMXYC_02985 [Candidatus Woesearchaeota archaeon]
MKCDICSATIQKTFLGKVIGTYVKKDGKKKIVCPICQKQYTASQILEKL